MTRTIDGWLATLFTPENCEAALRDLTMADTEADPVLVARSERAQARVRDADAKLARYRAALDAGADPAVVGGWIAEVRAERASAERDVLDSTPAAPMGEDELRAMVA